jgi:uncharacterized protein (TIGR01440 family)
MNTDIDLIGRQTAAAAEQLLSEAGLKQDRILVVGCSTSEVHGKAIGSSGSAEIAEAILTSLLTACKKYQIHLAVQCCEHLNRALVVERQVMEKYGLEEVNVIPVPHAGGSLGARAMLQFDDPVVVEAIQAHAGLDIGCTLIGMHLKPVAVPVRLSQDHIGKALLIAARTRPKLIGGDRAVYEFPQGNN